MVNLNFNPDFIKSIDKIDIQINFKVGTEIKDTLLEVDIGKIIINKN